MYSFGSTSQERLEQLDIRLQDILKEAIKFYDFSIITGYRNKEEQEKMFNQGKSKLRYPKSKHSQNPSKAVDIAPYPIDWNDTNRFVYLAAIIQYIAFSKGVKIRWGGNWDMDNDIIKDQTFNDLLHFEIVEV